MRQTLIFATAICLLIASIVQEVQSKALPKKVTDEDETATPGGGDAKEDKNSVKVSKRTLNHLITGLIGLLININPPPATATGVTEEDE